MHLDSIVSPQLWVPNRLSLLSGSSLSANTSSRGVGWNKFKNIFAHWHYWVWANLQQYQSRMLDSYFGSLASAAMPATWRPWVSDCFMSEMVPEQSRGVWAGSDSKRFSPRLFEELPKVATFDESHHISPLVCSRKRPSKSQTFETPCCKLSVWPFQF